MLDFSPAAHPRIFSAIHDLTSASLDVPDDVSRFVDAIFRYADLMTSVSLRAFHEDGPEVFHISSVHLRNGGLEALTERARAAIESASQSVRPVVFCPPLATFNPPDGAPNKAREQDLAEGLALSVECDHAPGQALRKLKELLGPPTVVVQSGGVTKEGEQKAHLHWRLNEPTAHRDDHLKLKRARALATAWVGGDASNVPIVHPIRWPGSMHRKKEPRLAHIVEFNPEAEIDLEAALEALEGVAQLTTPQLPQTPPVMPVAPPEPIPAPLPAALNSREEHDLIAAIQSGREFHEPLLRMAARLVGSGMHGGAATNFLRALMEAVPEQERDDRWKSRYDDIPRSVKSAEEKFAGDNTAEPVDLFARYEPPALPLGLLPQVIEDFAMVRGDMMGADPGGLAMAALTTCAAAIPDQIKLRVKLHDKQWLESARMWTGIVGPPSAKKSPILSPATAPLRKIDARLAKKYAILKAEYDAMGKNQKIVPVPKHVRKCIGDVTKEAAELILADSPHGVLDYHDELGGFFGAMEKYNGGNGAAADRAWWLQAFNGGEKISDRVGRGHTFIPNLSINLLGGIQPEVIRKVVATAQDDGLIQRIFPIVLRPGQADRDEPMGDVDAPYDALIERLCLKLRFPARTKDGDMDFTPDLEPVLVFSSEGQAVQRELANKHHKLLSVEAVNTKFAAHIGKYDGMFARLCVVWHCIEHAFDEYLPEEVSGDTARRVAKFLHEFLLPHAVAFYTGILGLSDQHDRVQTVAGYILAHGKETMTTRDVQRGDRVMKSLDHFEAHRILEQLENFGWLEAIEGPRNSKTRHWRVMPAVHKLFADKGRQEAARRRDAREAIAEIARGGRH